MDPKLKPWMEAGMPVASDYHGLLGVCYQNLIKNGEGRGHDTPLKVRLGRGLRKSVVLPVHA